MSQYDPTFDLKIKVGHCDLYFMVQWFCLISWRLFDIWTPYFGIMSQYDPMFDLKINLGHCDLYFIIHWFLPYIFIFDGWMSYFRKMRQCNTVQSFFNVCSEKHFSFIGKARFRRALISFLNLEFFTPNWENLSLDFIGNGAEFQPLRHQKKIPGTSGWILTKLAQTKVGKNPGFMSIAQPSGFCWENPGFTRVILGFTG